jgi:hypothetical protein
MSTPLSTPTPQRWRRLLINNCFFRNDFGKKKEKEYKENEVYGAGDGLSINLWITVSQRTSIDPLH